MQYLDYVDVQKYLVALKDARVGVANDTDGEGVFLEGLHKGLLSHASGMGSKEKR